MQAKNMQIGSAADALEYLRTNGFSIPEDGLEIWEKHRRNRNFLIKWAAGGVFLKQEKDTPLHVFAETSRLAIRLGHQDFKIAPRVLHNDLASRITAYDLIWPSKNGSEVFLSSPLMAKLSIIDRFCDSISLAQRLVCNPDLAPLKGTPWALSILSPHISSLATISTAGLQYIAVAQADASIASGIDGLINQWCETRIIHGDIRLENFLVEAETTYLIDWEMVQQGDPLWDYAGLASSVISHWVLGQPADNSGSSTELPLITEAECRACCRHILGRAHLEAEFDERKYWLSVGARLLQFGFEGCENRDSVPMEMAQLLQLASNVLSDTAIGRTHLS